jgi:hypothetical protein
VTNPDALRHLVGIAAIAGPILHSATDVVEILQGGFSPALLWANYVAFLPMPWLLLGIYAVHPLRPAVVGLVGAVLYGVAFTYFAHTTLVALAGDIPTYADLWSTLGPAYTVHGGLMVVGGLLFAGAAGRTGWLPRAALALFAGGIVVNLGFALVPLPEILQTLGTALRNAGLVVMGFKVLASARKAA